uniref:Uncharacterized protein n=1 Tax=Anguilla anguilla TaxID=7936 RepID=A0A0E9W2E8_ANGAN
MAVSYPVIDIQAQFLAHCATLPNFSSNVRGATCCYLNTIFQTQRVFIE